MPLAPKAQLRAELLAARRDRSPEALEAARTAICAHVLARAGAAGWHTVAAYEPLRTEPGSAALLDGLVAAGCRVIVPVTLPSRDLDWRTVGSDATLGVDAIRTCDAVLVPALAVARDGTRLGRGGGSYDRALPRRRDGVPVIALLFDDELVDALPAEPWDVPVSEVVCPAGSVALG